MLKIILKNFKHWIINVMLIFRNMQHTSYFSGTPSCDIKESLKFIICFPLISLCYIIRNRQSCSEYLISKEVRPKLWDFKDFANGVVKFSGFLPN